MTPILIWGANTPSLSSVLATRSIDIKVSAPPHTARILPSSVGSQSSRRPQNWITKYYTSPEILSIAIFYEMKTITNVRDL